MKGWHETTLGELCNLVTDGKHGDCRNEENSGYYFISAKDVRGGRIHYAQARQIVQDDFAETHRRTDLRPGDLLITNSGTIGRMAIAADDEKTPRTTFQKSVAVLKPKAEEISSRFLYYYLNANLTALIHPAAGAAQKNLLLGDIRRFRLKKPGLTEQERIVDSISPYDDLIENNRRRIALLEEVARMLYREWFVHFRFPGHEHAKIIDGLPEGWERPAASLVMDILSGGTPKTGNAAFWDGDIGFFTPKDATETPYVLNTEKTITEEGLRACNSKLYPTNTLFITARGTVGKLNLALVPMAMNQSCYALRSKAHFGQRYLYVALKAAIEQVRSRATGAVFDAVIVATFDRIPFLLPPENLTRSFEQSIDPMFDQIANLIQQNQKLVQARDLLLPRLMNGEIAV